jgi:hypothetical protein
MMPDYEPDDEDDDSSPDSWEQEDESTEFDNPMPE